MENYEKLGAFYLGRKHDLENDKTTDELLLYDSKDLTTHAVCIGMTGSGKTGLCISLLEEAAIDGIPSLIIDPKGDMTNLMLTFPELSPQEFRPWINESDASKKNITPDELAVKQSELWNSGLKSWSQDKSRVKRLRDSADFNIFTPGSTTGLPVSILDSFAAPPQELIDDSDAYNERISSTATGLLGLLGIDADPLKSREHIMLTTIFDHFWRKGQNLDLAELIQAVQSPPVDKIGVFNLDTFYPQKERFELAMQLNNLLAAPTFQSWLEGAPLDINELLYTDKGKARVSIFYIAHLSDAERMFFVSLLLNQLIAWMRMQPGTSSLRSLLYIDELYGYMPPVANPPSKKPLLTLLKQARAFGVGVVLSTQNPVDLDYKGLSNTGTWFIGRLQTERDRDRVLDGLSSASAGSKFDRKSMEDVISRVGKRVFLLHNVHDKSPQIFYTRWAMSYLAGPLTRPQISRLMADAPPVSAVTEEKPAARATRDEGQSERAPMTPGVSQLFMPIRSRKPEGAELVYHPHLWASAKVHFTKSSSKIDAERDVSMIVPFEDAAIAIDWDIASRHDIRDDALLEKEEETAKYAPIPNAAMKPKNYSSWEKEFKDQLYHSERLELLKSEMLKMTSLPGESEKDFRIRMNQSAREKRDEWIDKLRAKYARKMKSLETKIRRAEERVAREEDQSTQSKLQTAISIGTTVLGAFLGNKTLSKTTVSKAGTAMKRAGRSMKEAGDVKRAKENLELLNKELQNLEKEFQDEVDAYNEKNDVQNEALEVVSMRPLKSHILVQLVSFVWVPHWSIKGEIPRLA